MRPLTRVTLLDNTQRPKAPKIDGLTPRQLAQGRRLSLYHNMHRRQMDDVRSAIDQLDAPSLREKIASLHMAENFRQFGNLCGAECAMLNFHHNAEEAQMFPMLHEAGSAGLRQVVARLKAEHVVVHELIKELHAAAEMLLEAPSPENFAIAKSAFTDLETCVRSHFGYEETELAEALGVIDVGI